MAELKLEDFGAPQELDESAFTNVQKPQAEPGDFIRGLKQYVPQTQQMWGAGKAIAGKAFGSDSLVQSGLDSMREGQAKLEQIGSKPTDEISGVNGVGDFADWAQHGLGQVAGNLMESGATALAGAGLGALAGNPITAAAGGATGLIGKSIVKGALKDQAEKIAAQYGAQEAEKFVAKNIGKAVGTNAAIGAGAAFHGLGEPGSRAIEEAGYDMNNVDLGQVIPAAAAHAGAEFLGDKILLGGLAGHGTYRAPGTGLASLAKTVGGNAAIVAGKEIPVETFQTGAERYAAGLPLANADAGKEYLDTAAQTALFGVAGVPAGVRAYMQKLPDSGPLSRTVNAGVDSGATTLDPAPLALGYQAGSPLVTFPDGTTMTRAEYEQRVASGEQQRLDGMEQDNPLVRMAERAKERATETAPDRELAGLVANEKSDIDARRQSLSQIAQERQQVRQDKQAVRSQQGDGSFSGMNEFADLLNQEKQDVEGRRQGLSNTQQMRRESDLQSADARVADQMAREGEQRRRAVLESVLSDPTVQNHAAKFSAELKRQGFRDTAPTESELNTVSRFNDVRNAEEVPNVEPSLPNEDTMGIKERKESSAPQGGQRDKIAEVVQLVNDGWNVSGKTLISPTGKKRNLNFAERYAALKAKQGESSAAQSSPLAQEAPQANDAQAGAQPSAAQSTEGVDDGIKREIASHQTKLDEINSRRTPIVSQYNELVNQYKVADDSQKDQLRPILDGLSAQLDVIGREAMPIMSAVHKANQKLGDIKQQAANSEKYGAMPVGKKIGVIGHESNNEVYWEKTGDNEWTRNGIGSSKPTITNAKMEGVRDIPDAAKTVPDSSQSPTNVENTEQSLAIDVKPTGPSTIAKRDDLVGAIMRVTGGKGIAANQAQTIVGDKANAATKVRGLFTNGGTADLGDVAMLLRDEEGFSVKDGEHLSELIREQAAGNPVYSMERTERDAAANAEKEYKANVNQRADELGLKKTGGKRTLQMVEADIAAKEKEIARLESEAERQAIQTADILEDGEVSEAEFMRLLSEKVGYTEEEINAEVIRSQERADRKAEAVAGFAADEQAQGSVSEGYGNQSSAQATGGTEAGARSTEDFGLEGQTNKEAAEQFAQQNDPASDTVSKEQADRERDAVPFSMQQESQPKPQGRQTGMFTADGRVSSEAKPATVEAEKAADVAAEESKPEAITDFGEKLEGAKKDLWKSYQKAMSDELPADAKDITLSKHFPEPDYESLIASGLDIRAVAAIKAMRDAIPSKPRMKYKVTRWADNLKTLRTFANDIITGKQDIDHVLSEMRKVRGLSDLTESIALYSELGYPAFKNAGGYKVSGGWSADFDPMTREPKKKDVYGVTDGMGRVTFYETRQEAIDALRAKLQVEPENTGRSIKLDLYKVTSTGDIVIGKKVASNKFIDLKTGFKTAREAREYLKDHEAELLELLEKKKKVAPTRRSVNDPRVGKDYRQGEDVTPEKFAAEFGFRGVQFGNYVEQGRRVKDLNNAYDALLDLANTIGVTPRAISLNGSLGLAFGARGTGGVDPAAAHFEPGQIVINLTKMNGAGSLGHEWLHAMDNYFSRARNAKDGFLTAAPYERGDGVRPEVVQAFSDLMKAIKKSDFTKRSSKLDQRRSKDYWSQDEELAARSFEAYLIQKAEENGESNDYLANIVSDEAHTVYNEMLKDMGMEEEPYPYPNKAEQKEINPKFDALFETLKEKETEQGTALYSQGDAGEAVRISRNNAEKRIKSLLGDKLGKSLIDSGIVTFVNRGDKFQGATYENGNIVLNLDALTHENFDGVLQHEGFHYSIKELVGKETYDALMKQLDATLKLMNGGKWAKEANAAIPEDTKAEHRTEELGAYAIEQFVNGKPLPGAINRWVQNLLSALRATIIQHMPSGKLKNWAVANLKPQDLANLAIAGLKAKAAWQLQGHGREATAYSKSSLFHDARSFIRSVIGNKGAFRFFDFATVSKEEAAKLKEKTGLDVSGFKHTIDDLSIKHVMRKHGNMAAEISRGQIGVNEDDLAMIPDIVANYDSVERGEDQRDGTPAIVYKKTYGNGETYYVEEVRKGRMKLVSKSMWKVGSAVPRTTSSSEGVVNTSETSGGQPDTNVSDKKDDGNRYSKSKIIGDSGRNYDQKQRDFFKGVGRDIDQKTRVEKVADYLKNDFWKKMAVGIVDQFRGLRDLNDNGVSYMLSRLSKGTAGAVDAFLHHGKLSLKDGVYDADMTGGFIERLGAPLNGELDDMLWWVAANRAEKLSAEDRERLFTPEYIAAGKSLANGTTNFDYTIQTGPAKGSVTRNRQEIYKDANRVFNEFHKNALDITEQSGLIDAEARKIWESQFYVPFYRASEESGEFVGNKVSSQLVRQQAFKQLKGGTDKLNSDLLSNTLLNWSHLIEASAKNRAAKAALTAAEKVGVAQPVAANIGEYNAANGKMLPPGTKKTVWFMDNGQKKEYLVTDPFVMTAITSLEYAGMKNGIMDVLTKFKHYLTVGVTASPAFKVRNLIRDSIQAIGTSDLGYNPIKNVVDGFKQTKRDSQEYVSALASGGLIRFGTMLEGSESARTRQLIRQGVKDSSILNSEGKWKDFYNKFIEPGIDAYNELGNRSEEINRAALYNQLIKQGKSHAEAALMARDLMDFSMAGSFPTIRFLAQTVPFFSARLAGMYKLGRAAKEDPAKMAIVTGAVALAGMSLMLAYGDDDDWRKREDWDLNNYFWFKIGDTAFRIPRPFEIGAVASLAERSLQYMIDDEMTGERFRKVVGHLLMDNLSMNPTPQAIKPIVDLYANKDSFTGRPIETMGMDKLDPTERYTSNTSMVARGASNALMGAASPVQIDHLARSYFGWLGSFVVGGADMAARAMNDEPTKPTLDYFKFATQGIVSEANSPSSRYVTNIYDQAKELEQAYGTWHRMIKEGKIADAQEYAADNRDKLNRYKSVEVVKKVEAKFTERIRQIERSNIDPDEKKAQIANVNRMKDFAARRLTPGYNAQ